MPETLRRPAATYSSRGGNRRMAADAHGPATIGALLGDLERVLVRGGVEAAGTEARDMVAALLDVARSWPSLNSGAESTPELRLAALAAVAKRVAGAPQAYCVGRAAFRNLTLRVDERVLIPRPETELLVDIVLDRVRDQPGGIAVDVGTGSGALALALATEGRFDSVYATDVSLDALDVARMNLRGLEGKPCARVEFRHGALLAPLDGAPVRAIVSNPPYIAHREATSLPSSVRDWEPSVALFSGPEGMDATVRLISSAPGLLEADGLLALEIDSRRASQVAQALEADERYDRVEIRRDLAGRDRFVVAHRTEAG